MPASGTEQALVLGTLLGWMWYENNKTKAVAAGAKPPIIVRFAVDDKNRSTFVPNYAEVDTGVGTAIVKSGTNEIFRGQLRGVLEQYSAQSGEIIITNLIGTQGPLMPVDYRAGVEAIARSTGLSVRWVDTSLPHNLP